MQHAEARPHCDGIQERYFDRAVYRAASHPVVRSYAVPKIEYIAQKLPLQSQRILDVGCGNGVFTLPLAERVAGAIGLDRSANMLRHLPWRPLIRGDAAYLPFKDAAFTLAFEANLLHHADDPLGIVREMRRVSSDYVVLVEPNRLNPLMFAFGLVVRAERGTLRSSRRALTAMVARAGLEVVAVAAMGMISQNLTPTALVPLLRVFDREFAFGEYLVLIARRITVAAG